MHRIRFCGLVVGTLYLLCVGFFADAASATVSGKNGNLFVDRNGIVSMEAEHATVFELWTPVNGKSGSAFTCGPEGNRTNGKVWMRFAINLSRPGKYTMWILGVAENKQYGGNEFNGRIDVDTTVASAGDRANQGAPDFAYTKETPCPPQSMINAASTQLWLSRMPIDQQGQRYTKSQAGSWEDASKGIQWWSMCKSSRPCQSYTFKGPAYFEFKTAGYHTLEFASNAETGWVLDKVVLQYNSQSKPSGTGPAETLASTGTVIRGLSIAPEMVQPVAPRGDVCIQPARLLPTHPTYFLNGARLQSRTRGISPAVSWSLLAGQKRTPLH